MDPAGRLVPVSTDNSPVLATRVCQWAPSSLLHRSQPSGDDEAGAGDRRAGRPGRHPAEHGGLLGDALGAAARPGAPGGELWQGHESARAEQWAG